MGTRYHYDKRGRYKGKTIDGPPADDGCLWILVFIALCALVQGC